MSKASLDNKITSKTLKETADFALSFVQNLKPSKEGATVFNLSGDLGSGKTTFTKEVASLLGIKKEEVTSPTFVIEKIYAIQHKDFTHLIHIDAYRLEKSEELLHLGWEEITKDKNNLIFVEWGEKVKNILPRETKTIRFEFIDENTRTIELL
jgi:tRNA threonylcarbamoyladenosine biosynthesis protein TsaE